MRDKVNFDMRWMFYQGELGPVSKTVRKAGLICGLTNAVNDESGGPCALDETIDKDFVAGFRKHANEDTHTGWRAVELPHDWKLEQDYRNERALADQGYLPDGVGYYRKTFKLPKEDEGRKVIVEFEGISRNSSVWVNGCFVGDHLSGYTSFYYDITDMLKYGDDEGDNVILVRTDTTTGHEGWWYEGGGIYRHVWLHKFDYLHVKQWGTFIHTREINNNKAVVSIETTVLNEYTENMSYTLKTTFFDPGNREVCSVETDVETKWFSENTICQEAVIESPQLWSIETPSLYKAVVELLVDNQVKDSYDTVFGIRTMEYKTSGFYLNGKHVVLKGTCNHQDFAGVGTAVPDSIHEYRIRRLKEMGCNAYRSAHNPASPALLDICDRMGMLVMDENRILESTKTKIEDLISMIYRDRNHPCIFMWSLGNEELIKGSYQAKRMLKRLSGITKKLDPTRPVTTAELGMSEVDPFYFECLDVIGVNYADAPMYGGPGQDVINKMHLKHPEVNYLNAESCSYFSTRGAYEDDAERCQCSNFGSSFRARPDRPRGGVSSPMHSWNYYLKYPYTGGIFVWTGFDYRGEPVPFSKGCYSSQFGIMDTCGFPKDWFYYYQSIWKDEPMIHILPHWNWPQKEGLPVTVRAYTNCSETELFLNGKSLGRKEKHEDFLEWEVKYAPGELVAAGYVNGKEAARAVRETTSQAHSIHLKAENIVNGTKNKDAIIIIATVRDRSGRVVPVADNSISFEVSGAGKLLGLGNGNPGSCENDKGNLRRAFNGYCMAIVKPLCIEGTICIKAKSPGLASAKLNL